MLANEVREGQWVRFLTTDTKDQFTGFVVGFNPDGARVAIPSIRKTRTVPFPNLIDFEDTRFKVEDIDGMIDVALMTRDFDWVRDLSEMKDILQSWGK